tara:strand:+ start:1909 stop:2907 length:999 start_codon:yes stop_codon:yes gene_type:complete
MTQEIGEQIELYITYLCYISLIIWGYLILAYNVQAAYDVQTAAEGSGGAGLCVMSAGFFKKWVDRWREKNKSEMDTWEAAERAAAGTSSAASTKKTSLLWKKLQLNMIQQLMPHRGFAFVWQDSWTAWQSMKTKFLLNGLKSYHMFLKPIIMILLTVPLFIMSTVQTAMSLIRNLIIWLIILFLITLLTGDWGSAIGSSKAKGGNDGFSVNGSMEATTSWLFLPKNFTWWSIFSTLPCLQWICLMVDFCLMPLASGLKGATLDFFSSSKSKEGTPIQISDIPWITSLYLLAVPVPGWNGISGGGAGKWIFAGISTIAWIIPRWISKLSPNNT